MKKILRFSLFIALCAVFPSLGSSQVTMDSCAQVRKMILDPTYFNVADSNLSRMATLEILSQACHDKALEKKLDSINEVLAASFEEGIASWYWKLAFQINGFYVERSIALNQTAYRIGYADGPFYVAAFASLNAANLFDEYLGDYSKAYENAYKTYEIWLDIENEMEIANLEKYLGLLAGRLGNYSEAYTRLDRAIFLYDTLDFEPGKQVAQFDKCQVYELEGKTDSCLSCLLQCREQLSSANDCFRIIYVNCALIRVYSILNKREEALAIIAQTEKCISPDIHWMARLRFYFDCASFYKSNKMKKQFELYQNNYETLLKEIHNTGNRFPGF